jgi:PAS domain-containing protein
LQSVEYEIEWRVNLPPGAAPRWLLDRASPMPEADNPVVSYRGMMIDVTERKKRHWHWRSRIVIWSSALPSAPPD